MSAATAPPEILDGGAGFPGGGPAADLRAVFGDLMRLHAEAAGIRAEARHRVPHDLDERLAGLARGLGRAAGRLSTSCPSPRSVRSGRHGNGEGWAALGGPWSIFVHIRRKATTRPIHCRPTRPQLTFNA